MKLKRIISSNISFSRQLFLVFTFGMLSLALVASIATAWITSKQIRSQLISESLQVTRNLADQSYLALIYASGENAIDAVNTTLAFPGVKGVAILDLNHEQILSKGTYIDKSVSYPANKDLMLDAQLVSETESMLYFIAPVYEPIDTEQQSLFFKESSDRQLLGIVHVEVGKGTLDTNRNTIFTNNIAIAVIVTIGILFLLHAVLRRMTDPLDVLSKTMVRAQKGEKNVIAEINGPAEIENIAEVYNNMMLSLNERRDELFRQKERALITLESIADGVITTNTEGQIIYLNPVAERLIGYTTEQAMNLDLHKVFKLFNVKTHVEEQNPINICLQNGVMLGPMQHRLYRPELGDEIHIKDSVAPIRDRDGGISGSVMVFHDETEARKLEEKLSYQATHDALTGLTNRTEFENYLVKVIDNIDEDTEHALCYLDLDQFKVINDTCGHMAGDQLLQNITNLLMQRIRKNEDALARLGGDEFVLLIENCSIDQASHVANQIVQAVQEYRYVYDGNPFNVGISIGVVPLNNQTHNYQEVISKADAACFMAKEKGRNRVHVYLPDDEELLQRHGEMQILSDIADAFDNDRFFLFYQPIVSTSLADNLTRHYEILLRMKDSEGNWMSPGYFLPAAERYNMAPKIDRWVIRETLLWLKKHPEHLSQLRSCSINLSGVSLNDAELFAYIHTQFEETRVPAKKICFEITETSAITHLAGATTLISKLRDLGCQTALDDFGSGMSSFAYLKNFPIDYLKIDGIFVKDMLNDPIDDAMVKSINDIGHILGLKTIAEFVENEEIFARLQELGVDEAQGYYLAKPQPVEILLKG